MYQAFTSLFITLLFSAFGADPSNWNQWRGPDRTGIIPPGIFPTSNDEKHLQLKWKAFLDPSYSGPVLSPELVFTTETLKKNEKIVHAFDRKDGKKFGVQNGKAR